MSEHTKLPWMAEGGYIYAKNLPIACCFSEDRPFLANAAFIVRAVNSHAALVEALDGAWQIIQECKAGRPHMANFDYVETVIKPALALARGGSDAQ